VQSWIEEKTLFKIEPEYLLNTSYYDFGPQIIVSNGKKQIYFSSTRNESTGDAFDPRVGQNFTDIYVATQDPKGKWSIPLPISKDVNTALHEGSISMSADGKELYFTRCPYNEAEKWGCDIFYCKKRGRTWSNPVKLAFRQEGDDTSSYRHPALSNDGKSLVISSNQPGGIGANDLWKSTYDEKSKSWSKLINLGPNVNSTEDEVFPYQNWKGDLIFSSNGHEGMGGLDLFYATKKESGFNIPENMKPPFNSFSDDFGITYEPNEEKGYFSSNRAGTKGKDDIYTFWKDPLECTVEVNVYDSKTRAPIQGAKVEIESKICVKSNDGLTAVTGDIHFDNKTCKLDCDYDIEINAKNYLRAYEPLKTFGHDRSVAYILDFYLFSMDTVITLPEVRFPFDASYLLVDEEINSEDSLDFLYDIMVLNPEIKIELLAHTDTKGGVAYNLELSQRRAEACIAYLVNKGIPSSRMVPIGKGESTPRISDKEISAMSFVEEVDAAHQTNRRVEFRVIKEEF
jgi:outer membrane protein OmpA-like peptidoglycan-associated protein